MSVNVVADYSTADYSGFALRHDWAYSLDGTTWVQSTTAGGFWEVPYYLGVGQQFYLRCRPYALGGATPAAWLYWGNTTTAPGTAINFNPPSAIPGSLPTRQNTPEFVSGSLTTGAVDSTKTWALGKSGTIFSVAADAACGLRLYATAALRTADANRAWGLNNPNPTYGVLGEWLFQPGYLTIPKEILFSNLDGTPNAYIYATLINWGAPGTRTITPTYVTEES